MTANIKTLVDAFVTQINNQDYNIAEDINALQEALDAIAYANIGQASFANGETLSGTKTLTDDSASLQFLNPNSADRDVSLPAVAATNHAFVVMNTNGSNYVLTVKNAGGTVIRIIPAGKTYMFVSDGTQWVVVGFDLYKTISPAQITASQNNYNPTGAYEADIMRLDSDAAYNITGLAGGSAGRMKIIRNIGTYTLTFKNEDASSTAANRFDFGADFALETKKTMLLIYDPTSARWGMIGGGASSSSSSDPIGNKRLSLESGVPVSTTDQTAKTTVYWTDGTTNLSVAVPSTTNRPFDIFYSLSAGTLSTVNWTNDTTRATALAYSLGYLVKSGDIDKLYLGTGRTTGTSGQCEMKMSGGTSAAQKIFLWNYYNRVSFPILVTETTNTWAYTTAAWRQWNASANNQFEFVTGVAEDCVNMTVWGHMYTTSGALIAYFNLGLDRSNAKDSQVNTISTDAAANVTRLGAGVFNGRVSVGYHYLALIEYGRANGVVIGDEGGTNIQSGAFGTFYC